MMKNDSSAYDDFAWVYNRHWGERFTPKAVAVLDEVVLPVFPPDGKILDLCCGTGQLAAVLSERGFRITGLDGSVEMLKYAQENAPGVEFIQDSVLEFGFSEKFDLVTSFFDSLNHVMTLDGLRNVFRNVYGCIKDGGSFLFDMNLEAAYLTHPETYHGIIEDDHVCLFPRQYDADERTYTFDATIFRLKDVWYRSEVHLTQRVYSVEEITAALEAAGFTGIETFEYTVESGRQGVTADSKAAFFLCRK